MSGLGNWVARTVGPPATVPQMMADLLREHRTVTAAARAVGMDRRTWQRWATGYVRRPSPAKVERMRAGHDTAVLRDADVRLEVTDRDTDRHRVLDAERLSLRPGTMAAVAAEYRATGDQERAARVFLAGVGDDWYRKYLVPREGTAEPPPVERPASGGAGDDEDQDDDDFDEFDDFDGYDWWADLVDDADDQFGGEIGYGGEVA